MPDATPKKKKDEQIKMDGSTCIELGFRVSGYLKYINILMIYF